MRGLGARLIKLVALAAVALCVFGLAGATARPAADTGPWGVAVAADGLANIEVGKRRGREVSFRFRAVKTGQIRSVRIFLVFRSGGYMSGTGGQVRVELRPDNGHGAPAATSLASAVITNPTAETFPDVQFAKRPSVRAGARYHLVFTNPDADPVSNFVSINTLYARSGGQSPLAAGADDTAVLVRSSQTRSWRTEPERTAIFEVTYKNGRRQGQRYIDARSQSGEVTIGGDTQACQLFTSGVDRAVSSISVRARNEGSSSPLRLELRDDNGVVASSSIDPSRVSSAYGWSTAAVSATLRAGALYRVVLRSDQGPYAIFPYQKGIKYGFSNPFPAGRAALPDSSFDFPVFFSSRMLRASDASRDIGTSGSVLRDAASDC